MKKATKEKTTTVRNERERDTPRQYETMSQAQNRSGKGRQQNGSDGGSSKGRGSNH